MNDKSIFLAAMLTCVLAGAAQAIPPPPFFAEAMEYMDEQGIGNACLDLRLRAGEPSTIEVARSSGNAEFDALVVKGMHREVDDLKRFPVDWSKADAAGWRVVPLKFDSKDRGNKKVLGCAAPGAAR
jgi:hypothetical protein